MCSCVCVCVCVCASFTSFDIQLDGGRSALIKKLSLKIPKAIHQHGKAENGIAEKIKMI